MMAIDDAQTKGASLAASCAMIDMGVRTIQRWRKDRDAEDMRMGPKTTPANKLCKREREWVLAIMNLPEFRDLPPSQIVPRLADMGKYVASESTMYRVLKEHNQNAHRGNKKQSSKVLKPKEKVATAAGQLYSWDITYLRAPVRGEYFYLYMVLDVWSRKIVGHVVHEAENSELAARFIEETYRHEGSPKSPILHQDNGSPMTGATLLATLQELQIQPSYSRPHVSDDNPYSESAFGTMKTRPEYPTKPFANIEAAKSWVDAFVVWYNDEHRHSRIGFVTPNQRHGGQCEELLRKRRSVYEAAKRQNPRRWSGGVRRWNVREEVFLNPDRETLERLRN
jgi:putative transposase